MRSDQHPRPERGAISTYVPNAPHSGLRADRVASRLVRPGKMIKNVPASELAVPYFNHFSWVLFFRQKKSVNALLMSSAHHFPLF